MYFDVKQFTELHIYFIFSITHNTFMRYWWFFWWNAFGVAQTNIAIFSFIKRVLCYIMIHKCPQRSFSVSNLIENEIFFDKLILLCAHPCSFTHQWVSVNNDNKKNLAWAANMPELTKGCFLSVFSASERKFICVTFWLRQCLTVDKKRSQASFGLFTGHLF